MFSATKSPFWPTSSARLMLLAGLAFDSRAALAQSRGAPAPSEEAASPTRTAPPTGTASATDVVPPAEDRSAAVIAECLSTHTGGQKLRRERRLLESRQAFRQCSSPRCPQQVVRDCLTWLEQYERQIPSLSIRVTARGEDRWDALVFIDDEQVPDRRSGRAIDVDPGAHRIRVELAPLVPFQKEIVINEGEQFRMVDVVLDPPKPAPTPEVQVAREPSVHRPIPVASYVFAGVALAAAASGTAWALSMQSRHRELERTCAPLCPEREVDVLKERALFADVSWAVSAASLTSAVIVYLFRPEEPVASDAVQVHLSWMPHGEARGTLTIPTF